MKENKISRANASLTFFVGCSMNQEKLINFQSQVSSSEKLVESRNAEFYTPSARAHFKSHTIMVNKVTCKCKVCTFHLCRVYRQEHKYDKLEDNCNTK